jgi:diguanylate cyclase (GGDEF)-like protein
MTPDHRMDPKDLKDLGELGKEAVEVFAEDRLLVDPKLAERLAGLRRDRLRTLYTDLIYTLTHLRFDEETARRKWDSILRHKYLISEKLGRNVGIRVAILDYFLNITHELEHVTMVDVIKFEETARDSITDWLTGVFLKGYFLQLAQQELARDERSKNTTSILFLDLDHFKTFNDTNGHLMGDVLLQLVAHYVSDMIRPYDVMGRYGGEEFVILFPGMNTKEAVRRAEEIRSTVADLPFPGMQVMPDKRITISGGIATFPRHGAKLQELLDAADRALYAAKRAGRNRIEAASGGGD